MARQDSNGHGIRPNRNTSAGAAVLDHEESHSSTTKTDSRLHGEILRLVQASQEGLLTERARTEEFRGNDRKLLEGVNSILDALISPFTWLPITSINSRRGDVPSKDHHRLQG